MDVVCLGQQNWDVCWTGKQQLCTRLARRGHRVLYVDPDPEPAVDTRAAVKQAAKPQLREVSPRLWVHRFDHVATLPTAQNRKLRAKAIRRAVKKLAMVRPAALILRPGQDWLLRALKPTSVTYFATKDWTLVGETEAARNDLRHREQELIRHADMVIGVSPALVQRFAEINPAAIHLENAADVEHFSPHGLTSAEPHEAVFGVRKPVVGYVGQVDARLDQELLARLAQKRRDITIVLAGRQDRTLDVSRLHAEPNITLLGHIPYERLPSVMKVFDVCILPYVRTHETEAINPLQVFEYLATGLPVVGVPLDGLRECREGVMLAETPDAFVENVERALLNPQAGRQTRLDIARRNSWDVRTDQVEAILRESLENKQDRNWLPGKAAAAVDPSLDAKEASTRATMRNFARGRASTTRLIMVKAARLGGGIIRTARNLHAVAAGQSPEDVRRILVVRKGYLGDAVMLLPALKALRLRWPNARLDLAAPPGNAAAKLLRWAGMVDEVRSLEFMDRHRKERWAGMGQLLLDSYDLVLTGSWYFTQPEALMTGARIAAGLYDGHPQQAMLDRAVPLDPNEHEAEVTLRVAEALTGPVSAEDRVPLLVADAQAAGHAIAQRLNLPPDGKVVLLHPGSKRPSRRWPAGRFSRLARKLLETHPTLTIIVTGVPDEAPLVRRIIRRLPESLKERVRDGSGNSTLEELVGLLDRASLMICNDTGVMHLARARGTPLLAILGPENDRRWGPHPKGPGPSISIKVDVPCAPCGRDRCAQRWCLRLTSVEQAFEHAQRLLSNNVSLKVLELHRTRASFADIAAAGYNLPQVTVAVLPGADLSQLNRQQYPRLSRLDVSSPNEAAASCSTMLMLLLRPGDVLEPHAVECAVGAWQRSEPTAEAIVNELPAEPAEAPLDGRSLFDTTALRRRLGSLEPAITDATVQDAYGSDEVASSLTPAPTRDASTSSETALPSPSTP